MNVSRYSGPGRDAYCTDKAAYSYCYVIIIVCVSMIYMYDV